jgi:sigma-B regulation protein RsbU (phosphoserine phosphatase)
MLSHRVDRFSTVVLLRLQRDDEGWRVSLCTAGHPLPLLLSPEAPPVQVGQPGSLVGVFENVNLHEVHLRPQPGSAVVLFTDGVTEGRRGTEFYGDARLARVAGDNLGAVAERVANAVLEDALEFQGGMPQDDIAVVVVQVPA